MKPMNRFIRILTTVLVMMSLAPFAAFADPPTTEELPTTEGFNLGAYRGKRLVLLFYSIDTPRADLALKVMNELYFSRNEYNLEVIGICNNYDKPAAVQQFNRKHKVSIPVYIDKGLYRG